VSDNISLIELEKLSDF